jgi:hypothetical protein
MGFRRIADLLELRRSGASLIGYPALVDHAFLDQGFVDPRER